MTDRRTLTLADRRLIRIERKIGEEIEEKIIPLDTILDITKDKDDTVTLELHSGTYELKGDMARQVWQALSNISIPFKSKSESDVSFSPRKDPPLLALG